MNLPNTSEPDVREVGGELLEGSGFESERPSSAFEAFEHMAEEDNGQ